jgi:ubiquitin-conjugating enzyme E2 G1
MSSSAMSAGSRSGSMASAGGSVSKDVSLTTFATQHLMSQLMELKRHPPDNVSVGLFNDQLHMWECMFFGPMGSLYEGGFFKAMLIFPSDFPNNPPKMQFTTPILHPNVYPDGNVCISILHPPGEDQFNEQESADERWRPILGVEAILISVLSMLTDDEPNLDSPANIDAAVS